MTSGFVLGPGEGSAYGFHGSVAVIKASGEDTFGQLGVIESVYPAGLSVREHVHAGEDEMFYLLGGEMEVFCGEDRWTVGAGSFVFVPARPAAWLHGQRRRAGPRPGDHRPVPARRPDSGARRAGAAWPGAVMPGWRAGVAGGGTRSDRREVVGAVRGRYSTAVPFVFHDPVLEGVDLDDDVVHVFAAVDGIADDVLVFLVVTGVKVAESHVCSSLWLKSW